MIRIMFLGVLLTCVISRLCAAEELPSRALTESCSSLLSHTVQSLESDTAMNLCQYQGQVILMVNTASACGFTSQFEGLESLYRQFKDDGLVILGFPSNSFFQESLEGDQIADFCRLNYGVTFPVFEKIPVIGDDAHPLYEQLMLDLGKAPEWNFYKYLIDRNGEVVDLFPSHITPGSSHLLGRLQDLLGISK